MILIQICCSTRFFNASNLPLHHDIDDTKAWNDFASQIKKPTQPGYLGYHNSVESLISQNDYYLHLGTFYDFNDKAIEFLNQKKHFDIFISECSFSKVNPQNDEASPAVINFRSPSSALIYRCCVNDCKKDGNQYGIFAYCREECYQLHIVISTIATCKSETSSGGTIFYSSSNFYLNSFNLSNTNFSKNEAQQQAGYYIDNLHGVVRFCTFEENVARYNSLIYQTKSEINFNNVVIIQNKLLSQDGSMIYNFEKQSSLNKVYFVDNTGKNFSGSFSNKDVYSYDPSNLPHLSSFNCDAKIDIDPKPIRTPFQTSMATPQATLDERTQQVDVYHMNRKHYFIAE